MWDGDGAVRCLAEETFENTIALLLERCMPGTPLKRALPEPDQDVVVAALLRRLWDHQPREHHPFRQLQAMCDDWADSFEREPWLAIDPKPLIGDPAYDAIQHMLNCDARLAHDPVALTHRMADLLELDPNRVKLWLFARCAQEALHDPTMRTPAALLAP